MKKEHFIKYMRKYAVGIAVLLIALLSWYQLEISTDYVTPLECLNMEVQYIILNACTNMVIVSGFVILLNRVWKGCLAYSIFSFLMSIINYYVIQFHGMPFTFAELRNIRTAVNVLGAYRLEIDKWVVCIVFLFIVLLLICFLCKSLERGIELSVRKAVIRDFVLLLLDGLVIYAGYLSPNAVKPQNTIKFSWTEAYHTYGFTACTIEKTMQSFFTVDRPEGYTEEKILNFPIPVEEKSREETPDIILILNESFYDLRQITDIETNIPYMEHVDEMENTIRGYTVVPEVGGGTNSSEYELLTSNSLQLMQGITPFNVLKMKDANSIVSHLKQLGYTTAAAHSEKASNYSRGVAYPDMGFERIYFDVDFTAKEFYDARWFATDENLYKYMISWYEDMEEDKPRFMYLLTIQNHGGWEQTDEDAYIVKTTSIYGDLQGQINEYLTCIYMTDSAFAELTEYFKNVDRKVVVCMAGDHSPSFARDIVDGNYENRMLMKLRSTPFIIWANYDIEDENVGYIGMNYLVPLLLDKMNIEVSPYYQYMIDLHKKVPVLTDYNVYMDSMYNEHTYDEINDYTEMINNYFYLEYHNLQKERRQELFNAYG